MPNNGAAVEAAIRAGLQADFGHLATDRRHSLTAALNAAKYLLATCDSLRAERNSLREALEEVLRSGVEFDDPRVNYVIMQVDRDTLAQARAALAVQKEK